MGCVLTKCSNISQEKEKRCGLADIYEMGDIIGSGSYSVVRHARHKQTGEEYAIKCIKLKALTDDAQAALEREINILQQMNHPNIISLCDVFIEDYHYYLVTAFLHGGDLLDRIVRKEHYSESEARDVIKLLLEAIHYCHSCNIVHRDLKPENILLATLDDTASIKIADFGFAKQILTDQENLNTACGTPCYVAPEIISRKTYGKEVDIWSLGVITYIILCGYPPFYDGNPKTLFRKIAEGNFKFDSPYWDNVSIDAKDLILRMLVTDPKKRSTAENLLKHRWIVGNQLDELQLTCTLERLYRYNIRRKFKGAVRSVQLTQRLGHLAHEDNFYPSTEIVNEFIELGESDIFNKEENDADDADDADKEDDKNLDDKKQNKEIRILSSSDEINKEKECSTNVSHCDGKELDIENEENADNKKSESFNQRIVKRIRNSMKTKDSKDIVGLQENMEIEDIRVNLKEMDEHLVGKAIDGPLDGEKDVQSVQSSLDTTTTTTIKRANTPVIVQENSIKESQFSSPEIVGSKEIFSFLK